MVSLGEGHGPWELLSLQSPFMSICAWHKPTAMWSEFSILSEESQYGEEGMSCSSSSSEVVRFEWSRTTTPSEGGRLEGFLAGSDSVRDLDSCWAFLLRFHFIRRFWNQIFTWKVKNGFEVRELGVFLLIFKSIIVSKIVFFSYKLTLFIFKKFEPRN